MNQMDKLTDTLILKLSPDEKARIRDEAEAKNLSISNYVRQKLKLPKRQQGVRQK